MHQRRRASTAGALFCVYRVSGVQEGGSLAGKDSSEEEVTASRSQIFPRCRYIERSGSRRSDSSGCFGHDIAGFHQFLEALQVFSDCLARIIPEHARNPLTELTRRRIVLHGHKHQRARCRRHRIRTGPNRRYRHRSLRATASRSPSLECHSQFRRPTRHSCLPALWRPNATVDHSRPSRSQDDP